MQPIILLIDDDRNLLDVLSLSFKDNGYSVECAADGSEGWTRMTAAQPDLVVCDVNMPNLDGFALCRKVREAGNSVPFILLTSRDSEIDEALGLELGADDYISKPFSTRVLLARCATLLRRQKMRDAPPAAAYTIDELELDNERLTIRFRGQAITTTVTEFRLLEILVRRPSVVFSRAQLLDLLRGNEVVVAERIIDTYVRRLRRKFENIAADFDRIETVIGAGYRWRADGR